MTEYTEYEERISGNDFRRMIAGAYGYFEQERAAIDALNVFPVPDGDTGANMLHTLGAVARAVAEAEEDDIGSLAKRAADSAIMGARGNSGVILSQIFRGLGRGLAGKRAANSEELGKAFQYGVLYAYRAVARPVEGTILTVAKGIAKGTYHAVRGNLPIEEILEAAIRAGEVELLMTPELLPALREAGVVDAGGRGLIVFLEGCLQGLGGAYAAVQAPLEMRVKSRRVTMEEELDIARPYCTEFIVKHTKVTAGEAKVALGELGDSLIVAEGNEALKIHLHTAHPGLVLERAVGWGTLHDIKIDNMADQHRATLMAEAKPKMKTAAIAVAAGEGLGAIMRELGAAIVIAGGQSMNPAVEDLVSAVHSGIAERYVLLPNNSNILLAAAQVKKLLGDLVEIVPTRNTPQGLAALASYDAGLDAAENAAQMASAAEPVREAAITRAVRDSAMSGLRVENGDYIGVIGGDVKVAGKSLGCVLEETLRRLSSEEAELITIYYGADTAREAAEALALRVRSVAPHAEVEVYDGGQPLYELILSVE